MKGYNYKRDYRISDRKEPRFNTKQWRYKPLNKELFERFQKENPEIEMDYKFFEDTIMSINEEFVNFIMTNKEGVFLPSGLGRLYLGLFPPKERQRNAQVIQNKGIYATHFDFDSNGFVGKIIWLFDDTRYKTANLRYYGFAGCRLFKNRASKAFRETPEKYIRAANIIRQHEFFKRKKNERNEINSQSSNQSNQDTEQSGECGLETDE